MKKIISEMLYMKKYSQDRKVFSKARGFSLIEVLFSLLVFAIGIVSVVSIMTANIKVSVNSKDQIIAAQLTQEGIEFIKNLIDNADPRVTGNILPYNNYRVDMPDSSGIRFAPAGGLYRLYLNSTSGIYSHNSSGAVTKFARRIDLDANSDGLEVGKKIVTSTVSWDGTGTFPDVCNISNKCAKATLVISPAILPHP